MKKDIHIIHRQELESDMVSSCVGHCSTWLVQFLFLSIIPYEYCVHIVDKTDNKLLFSVR